MEWPWYDLEAARSYQRVLLSKLDGEEGVLENPRVLEMEKDKSALSLHNRYYLHFSNPARVAGTETLAVLWRKVYCSCSDDKVPDGFAIGVALEIGGLEISSTSPSGKRGVITKSIASSPVTNEGESFGAGGTFFSGRL